ncbi:MAG TPA: hypothetical protein VMY06_03535 [Sedimentisphaerales bacterium]|nr:hypothetical protein [Sedimentisphaerales bacterium]
MEGWRAFQCRSASVPGLLPFSDVGVVYYDRLFRSPSTAIGLSQGKSFIITTTIGFPGCAADLIALRDKLMELNLSAVKVVSDKMYLNSLRYSQAENNEEKQSQQEQISTALEAYKTSRDGFEAKHKEVAEKMKKKGLFIYRWTTTSGVQSDLKLGDILTPNFSKREQYSGFAIVGGLRLSTLYIGKDLACKWKEQDWIKSIYNADDFKVTTHLMQAKNILYVSEYELEANLKNVVEASYKQWKNIPDAIKALDTVEFEAIASTLSNLSNIGFLGDAQYEPHPVNWELTEKTALTDPNGWQSFFCVQTQLDELVKTSKRAGDRRHIRKKVQNDTR